jgi:multidrug/hemolysin transport system ATP-binding protein
MEEAAEADYVVIIDSGKVAAEGSPLELKNRYTGDFVTLYGVNEEQVRALGADYKSVPNGFCLSVPDTQRAAQLIIENPHAFKDFEITKGKMDDVFLAVTGRSLGSDGDGK